MHGRGSLPRTAPTRISRQTAKNTSSTSGSTENPSGALNSKKISLKRHSVSPSRLQLSITTPPTNLHTIASASTQSLVLDTADLRPLDRDEPAAHGRQSTGALQHLQQAQLGPTQGSSSSSRCLMRASTRRSISNLSSTSSPRSI